MPRVKFRLAAGYSKAEVNCVFFVHDPGKLPECIALNHPWCLAIGSAGPEGCKFRKPRKQKELSNGDTT